MNAMPPTGKIMDELLDSGMMNASFRLTFCECRYDDINDSRHFHQFLRWVDSLHPSMEKIQPHQHKGYCPAYTGSVERHTCGRDNP